MARTQSKPRPESRAKGKARPAPKRRGGSGPQAPNEWWAQAVEVPRADTDNARRASRRGRWIYRYTIAAAVLFPIASVGWMFSLGHGQAVATPEDPEAQYAATRPVAMNDATQWLDTDPSPLPGGHVVSWDSATSTEVADQKGDPGSGYDVEVHHLTLADPAGNLFDSTLTLVVNDNGASMAGSPTLVPEAPSAFNGQDATIWPGLQPGNVDAAVRTAVTNWADAMSSGDPQQLATAIGDGTDPVYMPLVGATLSKADVEQAANLDAVPNDGQNGDAIIVRATFDIKWAGVRIPSGTSPATVSYDLRLDYDDKGNPTVDAWGGPGEGPDLEPYANAVSGERTLVANGGISGGVTSQEG